MQPNSFGRRAFLLGAGGVISVTPWAVAWPRSAHAQQGELGAQRRDAFAALIVALGAVPGSGVDGRRAEADAADLATAYANGSPALQANMDAVLDAVTGVLSGSSAERADKARSLSSKDIRQRRRYVSARLLDENPANRGRGQDSLPPATLTAAAIELAALPSYAARMKDPEAAPFDPAPLLDLVRRDNP